MDNASNAISLLTPTVAAVSASRPSPSTLPSPLSSEARAVTKRYGDRARFLATFHVDQQARHTTAPARCVCGTAPTLAQVNAAYGEGTAQEWLVYQIGEFVSFLSLNKDIESYQMKQLAKMVYNDYNWMKVTEIELFFYNMKRGRYEDFYGQFDTQRFMRCFEPFMRDLNEILDEEYQKEERARREHQFDGCVSWNEYLSTHPDAEDPLEAYNRVIAEYERRKQEMQEEARRQDEAHRAELRRLHEAKVQEMMGKYGDGSPKSHI